MTYPSWGEPWEQLPEKVLSGRCQSICGSQMCCAVSNWAKLQLNYSCAFLSWDSQPKLTAISLRRNWPFLRPPSIKHSTAFVLRWSGFLQHSADGGGQSEAVKHRKRVMLWLCWFSAHRMQEGKKWRGHRTRLARRPASTQMLFNQDSTQCFHKDIDIGRRPLRAVILTFVSPLATANFISQQSELIRLLSWRLFTGVNSGGCHFVAAEAVAQTYYSGSTAQQKSRIITNSLQHPNPLCQCRFFFFSTILSCISARSPR